MIPQLVYLPFVLSLVVGTAITYLTILGYRAMGIVDKSTAKEHPKHIHERAVPRGGGIPVFAAIVITSLLFGAFEAKMAGIFVGAFIVMALGVLDDIMDLSPYLRLVIGVAAGAIVVAGGVTIAYVSNPLGGAPVLFGNWIVSAVISILWIVWSMNFVNMGAKGLDGQLPGVVVIAATVLGIMSLRDTADAGASAATYLAFAVAGAYGGLLVFNVYPQRIMPGWGGGALAGFFLAVLSMLSGAKLATALIVLGVPLMDVVYAIMRRIRAGKSPVWGDAQHLHHQLLKLGWSKRVVAGFYWLVTAGLGITALQLNSQMKLYTICLIGIVVGGILLWANLLLSPRPRAFHNG